MQHGGVRARQRQERAPGAPGEPGGKSQRERRRGRPQVPSAVPSPVTDKWVKPELQEGKSKSLTLQPP